MTLLKLAIVGRLLIRVILKVAHEFHSLLVKIPVTCLARVQLSLQVSMKVIKLPTTPPIELLAFVVVSLVTFTETAHQTQAIYKLVSVTPPKMSSSAWMKKINEYLCAVDLLMVHLYLLYVEILAVVVLLFQILFFLMPLLLKSLMLMCMTIWVKWILSLLFTMSLLHWLGECNLCSH